MGASGSGPVDSDVVVVLIEKIRVVFVPTGPETSSRDRKRVCEDASPTSESMNGPPKLAMLAKVLTAAVPGSIVTTFSPSEPRRVPVDGWTTRPWEGGGLCCGSERM